MQIFLSYPHKDTEKAKQLKATLLAGGFTVWMDDQLVIGEPWHNQLETQIKAAQAIVFALTPNWVSSPNCNWEFITSVENNKVIIPVLLTAGTSLPERLGQYQYADLSMGFDPDKVQKMLNDLLGLAQKVDKSVVSEMNKAEFAKRIDNLTNIKGDNISNNQNTVTFGGSAGGNINIGGTQKVRGDVNINYQSIASKQEGSPLNDIRALLQKLEKTLKQIPEEQQEDVELIHDYANEIAEEVSKDTPRKKRLTITADNLKRASETLSSVAPIALEIAKALESI